MRFPRYRIRALLVLIACASALLAAARDRLLRDREAGAIIEKLHCRSYNDVSYGPFAWFPRPLSNLIWPRYLNADVRFGWNPPSYGVQLHDDDLCELARLQHLHVLFINADNADPNEPITDEGIKCLSRCRELARLAITRTVMTDAALAAIGEIKTLRFLGISAPRVTGAGLRHLEALPELVKLNLSETAVGDDAVEVIAQIKSVRILYVGQTRITADGCDRLRALLPKTYVLGPTNAADPDMLEIPPEAAPYYDY